jgi:hypothetical protein
MLKRREVIGHNKHRRVGMENSIDTFSESIGFNWNRIIGIYYGKMRLCE